MRLPQYFPAGTKQRGAALMIMLVVMIIGAITIFVSSLNSSALKIERDKATAAALAQAKDALVGYAITYGDTHAGQVHGYLPCPDIDGSASGNLEGSSELSCGGKNVSSNGKLPWKTLGLPTLRDGHGECLWYAVSGTFQSNQKTDMMNWDTPGLFEILDASGSTVAQNVVAVVFAPGAALDGQNRASDGTAPTCGGNYTPANYLDNDGTINNAAVSGTANAISQFRLGASAQLNDQIIFITRDDIFNARNIRAKLAAMTQKAAECLADYGNRNSSGLGNKRLPWSGRLRNPTSDYWTDSNYDDEDNRLAGRLPYRVNTSDADTGNQIDYPYYQLASNGANCPGVADWPAYYPWWSNWKDHLFYALADDFKPKDSSGSCGTCLRVNGSGSYAAVVMFADRKLAGQSRDSGADRLNFANYLEGRNFTNGSNWFGNGNYQSGAETADFNDVLYCIRPDLTVTPC